MAVLGKHGITRMMVEAGGNIGLGDPPPGRLGWRIGIAPPDVRSPPREYLWLSRCAISTSGDMWQYAIIGGKRYSHLIDPKTGMALTDRSSVTVVCRRPWRSSGRGRDSRWWKRRPRPPLLSCA
jgi:thiamine biosynthesis lipoprotein